MSLLFQNSRSVLAALAFGSLAPAPGTNAQNLQGALPSGRPEHPGGVSSERELTSRDLPEISARRLELQVICRAGGEEPRFVRFQHALTVITSVERDLERSSVVRLPDEQVQFLSRVLADLSSVYREWQSIQRVEQAHSQLLRAAQAGSAPSWLLVSCQGGLIDAKNITTDWRTGEEWQPSLLRVSDEFEPLKKLVEMWTSARAALSAHSEFEVDQGERLSRSFENYLRSSRSDAEVLLSRLRDGPQGEQLSAFLLALAPLYYVAEDLSRTCGQLSIDTVYRAQRYQDGRLEAMSDTVKKGLYVVTAGCVLTLVGMFLDGWRRGRERAGNVFGSGARPLRQLSEKERDRISQRW